MWEAGKLYFDKIAAKRNEYTARLIAVGRKSVNSVYMSNFKSWVQFLEVLFV
jgi:hypothetical protein